MTDVFIFSLLRSGSHMLRSMLMAEPSLYDAGQYVERGGNFSGWLDEHQAEAGGREMLVNPKVTHSRDPRELLAVVKDRGGAVLFLSRRNLLEQVVSWELAVQRRYHPELGDKLHVNHDANQIARKVEQVRQAVSVFREAAAETGLPFMEIAYEDLGSISLVASSFEALLGRPIAVRAAITEKVTPPISEVAPWLAGLDQ